MSKNLNGNIQEQFQLLDNVGDGKIAVMDVPLLLRASKIVVSEADLEVYIKQWKEKQIYIKQWKEKQIERITIQDFLPVFSALKAVTDETQKERPQIEDFAALLDNLDYHKTGNVSDLDLRLFLQQGKEGLSEKETNQLFQFMNLTGPTICASDFVRTLLEDDDQR
uniref:Uncharacterized protein n=1 Tax=Panagrolaimus sp. JU765 TaxID=591449 RepID=A0AC34QRK8_9BILA